MYKEVIIRENYKDGYLFESLESLVNLVIHMKKCKMFDEIFVKISKLMIILY